MNDNTNTVYVECEKSDNCNNEGNWSHLKIIQTSRTTENSHTEHWHILQNTVLYEYKIMIMGNNIMFIMQNNFTCTT